MSRAWASRGEVAMVAANFNRQTTVPRGVGCRREVLQDTASVLTKRTYG